MRKGRRLTVRTRLLALARWKVVVSDIGTGIPEEDLERIFSPFVTSKAEGMGLGLAVRTTTINRMAASSGPATTRTAKPPARPCPRIAEPAGCDPGPIVRHPRVVSCASQLCPGCRRCPAAHLPTPHDADRLPSCWQHRGFA